MSISLTSWRKSILNREKEKQDKETLLTFFILFQSILVREWENNSACWVEAKKKEIFTTTISPVLNALTL